VKSDAMLRCSASPYRAVRFGLAPRLAPDFIRSFIVRTSDSAH
jgi:hypothetical protein